MPSFEEFIPEIKKQYQAVFAAEDELPGLANIIFNRPVAGTPQKVIRALSMIVVNDFHALLRLVECGHGVAAAKIARTMFETSVNIRYLRKVPGDIQDFIDFHQFSNKIFYDQVQEVAPEAVAALPKEDVDQTNAIYERVKDRFPTRPPYSWSKKSLFKRAQESEYHVLYRMLYSILSGLVHGDIRAILAQTDEESMTVPQAPSTVWVEQALAIGHHALFMALADYNELLGFPFDTEIDAVRTAYDRAWPEPAK